MFHVPDICVKLIFGYVLLNKEFQMVYESDKMIYQILEFI